MTDINTMADNVTPMFQPVLRKKQGNNMTKEKELSIFDVKELYDKAYEAKEYGAKNEDVFQELLAKAIKIDMEYRQQLAKKTSFRYVSHPSAVADRVFGTKERVA